jgi:hypothetical protein
MLQYWYLILGCKVYILKSQAVTYPAGNGILVYIYNINRSSPKVNKSVKINYFVSTPLQIISYRSYVHSMSQI